MSTTDEQALIGEMVSALRQKMAADYPEGKTRRDAHPKCHGLLQGTFTILADLPEPCRYGVFSVPAVYPCWIRSSAASGSVQSDEEKDLRGIAIKLMGVDGERISGPERQTQDFLLMSIPTMPLGTVKMFRDAVCTAARYGPLALVLRFLLSGRIGVIKALAGGKAHQTSPLDIAYWSTTPYGLGPGTVKYHVRPTSTYKSQLPASLSDDYLTANMATHLGAQPASFDFFVQFHSDDTRTPIEDAAVEWEEADSPFIKVATLQIPPQEVDSERRFDLAERFSFSPANCLSAHAPKGGINRARRVIYQQLSEFRHKRDNIALCEPTPEDQFGLQ